MINVDRFLISLIIGVSLASCTRDSCTSSTSEPISPATVQKNETKGEKKDQNVIQAEQGKTTDQKAALPKEGASETADIKTKTGPEKVTDQSKKIESKDNHSATGTSPQKNSEKGKSPVSEAQSKSKTKNGSPNTIAPAK